MELFNMIVLLSIVLQAKSITATGIVTEPSIDIQIFKNKISINWTHPPWRSSFTQLIIRKITDNIMQRLVDRNITSEIVPFETTLSSCFQYDVTILFRNTSNIVLRLRKGFFISDKTYYTPLHSDVKIEWTTTLRDYYRVTAPPMTLYNVYPDGNVHLNFQNDEQKYRLGSFRHSDQSIQITVLNVTQNDGGFYKSSGLTNRSVMECCLLYVTDKPSTPSLTINTHSVCGERLDLKCESHVQRWPLEHFASVTYTFFINGVEFNPRKLIIKEEHRRSVVYCQSFDDRGEQSAKSNVINLDPFCDPVVESFENKKIATDINTEEGVILHVLSLLKPNVTWLNGSNYTWTVLSHNGGYKHILYSKVKVTRFPIDRRYDIKICNIVGCVVENVITTERGIPEGVKNLSVFDITKYSVSLLWFAGFDGGAVQKFYIQLQVENDVPKRWNVSTSKTTEGAINLFRISSLLSDTAYHGLIVASNEYGDNKTRFSFRTTFDVNDLSEREVIVYSLTIICIIGMVTVFIVIINCRQKLVLRGSTRPNCEKSKTGMEVIYDEVPNEINNEKKSAENSRIAQKQTWSNTNPGISKIQTELDANSEISQNQTGSNKKSGVAESDQLNVFPSGAYSEVHYKAADSKDVKGSQLSDTHSENPRIALKPCTHTYDNDVGDTAKRQSEEGTYEGLVESYPVQPKNMYASLDHVE